MPSADEILAAYDARREVDSVGGPLGYLGYRPTATPWQQYDYSQLPDVGAPLIPGGQQVSAGYRPITNVTEGLTRDIPKAFQWFYNQASKDPAAAQQDVRDAAYGLASLPARTFEASERMRSGDVYNPAPAVDAVTMMMGGALPWAEKGAAGVFGGRLAKTADPAKFALAEQLEAQGASAAHIRARTGLTKFPDQQWRFEIPDQHSRLTQKAFDEIDRQRGMTTMGQHPVTPLTLGDYLHHPELYKAYPEAANVPVFIDAARSGAGGSFGAGGAKVGDISQADIVLNAATKDPRSVLLHEGQHLIQHAEGFAPGANTYMLKPGTPAWDIYDSILKKLSSPTPEAELRAANMLSPEYTYADYVKEYRAAMKDPEKRAALDRMAQETAVRDAYKRSAGEAEARSVQTRRDYTDEQRRLIPPEATFDVPMDRQLVDKYRMLNPAEMRAEAPRDPRMWSPLSKLKLQKPIDELEHSFTGKPVAKPPVIDPASLVGQYGYFTPTDLSATGRTVTAIDNVKLGTPIRQHGGVGFQKETGLGWASEPSVARKMDRQIAEFADKGPVNIIPFTMAPQAIDASHHVAQPLSQLLTQAPITRANAAAFDEYMRGIRPDWVGIKKPNFPDYIANMEKGMKAKRAMAQEMEKARWSSKGFPNVAAVRHAMSDMSLVDLPRYSTGMSIARYEPGQGLVSTSHPSYSRGVAASKQVPVSRVAEPVPFEIFAPDIAAGLDAVNARNRAAGKKGTISPRYHMEKPTEGVPLVQEFTPQWLEQFMAHVNKVKG